MSCLKSKVYDHVKICNEDSTHSVAGIGGWLTIPISHIHLGLSHKVDIDSSMSAFRAHLAPWDRRGEIPRRALQGHRFEEKDVSTMGWAKPRFCLRGCPLESTRSKPN